MVKSVVSEHPAVLSKDLILILKTYVIDKFLTSSLLQQTRTLIQKLVFGEPSANVRYVNELSHQLEALGDDCELDTKPSTSEGGGDSSNRAL